MPYIYKSGLQFGINETNIYGGASYVELTQAEYDALSDAEKHNGQIYFITDGNYDFLIVNDSVPVGSIQAYGGMSAPTNWLICDGSAISRTDYKELFQIIGTTYGAGDGSTTFNLPDLRGKVAIGPNTAHLLGTSGGQEEHIHTTGNFTLGINHIPSHNHNSRSLTGAITFRDHAGGDHNLVLSASGIASVTKTDWSGSHGAAASTSISGYKYNNVNLNATHTHDAQGGGQAHNHGNTGSTSNMQPYLVTNYIIKAKNPSITSGQQLQAMELFYPVGSYFETSDSTFDPNVEWGGEWSCQIPQEVLINTGSVTVNANQTYNLCTITLEPNTEYMIYTNVKTNNGNSLTLLNAIDINGTVKNQHGAEARVTTSSGQGVANWKYVYTDNNTVTATLKCYGYYTTSHTEEGRIIAVPINRTLNYKWHRTA